jgi:predicted  nucleic acid-binding Zn-ribbon protein
VTELEQQVAREEYRYEHINEALKQANARISMQSEEQHLMIASWESERADIRQQAFSESKQKDEEIRVLALEKDVVKEKLGNALVIIFSTCL